MKRKAFFMVIAAAVIISFIVGRYSGHSTLVEKKPMYWVDSMEPTIHYSKPGQSRMGMELAPVYPDEGQGNDQASVRISPTLVNNLGVRITPVTQGTFAKRIMAAGYVEPNENKITHIHSYAEGWIKKLFVKSIDAPVKKGELLLQLYSPLLVNAQEEYLISVESNNQSLINASNKKLQALHISEQQIQQLKTTQKSSQLVDVYSPQDGIITEINIREGMHITPDTQMMSIVDLSTIWMIAEIYEDQANWVKIGETAQARISAFPGKVWQGEIDYIYPQVDPTTRTIKVRLRFNNPDKLLKPNMYTNISLFSSPQSNVLSIPLEALIQSSAGNRVIVSLGDGHFQARAVISGIESGDRVQIISGLKTGEMVVASGQFLIDSETNLKSGLERLDSTSNSANTSSGAVPLNPVIEGKGIIKVLNSAQHSLTLVHEAIPALNWPVMTMGFSVEKTIDLTQFKVGDHVQFILKSASDNQFITEIKKISD